MEFFSNKLKTIKMKIIKDCYIKLLLLSLLLVLFFWYYCCCYCCYHYYYLKYLVLNSGELRQDLRLGGTCCNTSSQTVLRHMLSDWAHAQRSTLGDVNNIKMMSTNIVSSFSLAYQSICVGFWASIKYSRILMNYLPSSVLVNC